MSIRKLLLFLLIGYTVFNIGRYGFAAFIDVSEEVLPVRTGKIIKFERFDNGRGQNWVDLAIRTENGNVFSFDRAEGANYQIGETITVHEYRTKYTNKTFYAFRK